MISHPKILLADDEAQIRRALKTSFSSHGYVILEARTGEEAVEKMESDGPDLVILDQNMPGMGGLAACREIREKYDVPIIFLSVRDSEKDKVRALDAGADDYVVKPFSTQELLARVRASLRRSGPEAPQLPQVESKDLSIDFEQRRVRANGRDVRLTPKEFELLKHLVVNHDKPLPHRQLLQAAWGPDYGEQSEYLRVFINQLRKKIEADPAHPKYILTEPWVGYRFKLP